MMKRVFHKTNRWQWGMLLLLVSCGQAKKDAPLFTLMEDTGISFQNTVVDSREENSFLFRNFYNGGGVAIGDINNDGLPDVLLTANMGENKLYLNKGNFKFQDITAGSGMKQDSMWSTGAVMADVNDDGWLDIYVCNSGHIKNGHRKNKLYINDRNGHFTEQAAAFGLDVSGFCTQASFFDYDLDGDLDCFIINNSPIPFSSLNFAGMRDDAGSALRLDSSLQGGGNHLYRNDGGHYIEVTKESGLHSGPISFGLGVSVGDINSDGYPDIYVGNDFIEKDYLYINQKNGTFKDELEERLQQISMSSMSSDLADVNNDGRPEIFTTDMIPDDDYRLKTTGTFDNIDLYLSKQKAGLYRQFVRNCLQLNNGDGSFSETANYSGVEATDWSWGALFFDADNDGMNDLFICNGINRDLGDLDFLEFFSGEVYAQMVSTGRKQEVDEILKKIPVHPLPNRMYQNQGELKFTDRAADWGLGKPSFSNSVAYADLDNDGDLDLVVNNENMPAFVYRNNARQQNKNNYIAFRLQGEKGNRFAVGSRISVYSGDSVFYRELNPSRGFQSAVDYKLLIGLGRLKQVDSVIVTWPNGTSSHVNVNSLNKTYTLNQPTLPLPPPLPLPLPPPSLFSSLPSPFLPHTEDDFIDFYYERNLPEMISCEGPHMATADVNGDGREDIFIGGAKGQAGQLYLQDASGNFERKQEQAFDLCRQFEDVAMVFFDADQDGDQDLFVGSGGNNVPAGGKELQHRLFLNDGKGTFTLDTSVFTPNSMNISVAIANDYDGDGDEDLFVGGRSVPYAYGVAPRSYLYRNDGKGHFTDVTPDLLKTPGMITGGVWVDVTGDGKKELVLCGEYMAPRVFAFHGLNCVELKETGLKNMSGLWQTVAAADINGDGKQDIVLGNIGENFYLRPDEEHPVKLWVGDLDGNGTQDQFLTKTINGKDMPVFLKRDVTEQFPMLKKENLRHSDYAVKTIQQLFPEAVLKQASIKEFNFCSSVIALNQGKGKFSVTSLPYQAQLSSVHAIAFRDLDGNGKLDLLLGGNSSIFPPQFGRLDASYGQVWLNRREGNFACMPQASSGLQWKGDVKDVRFVQTVAGPRMLVLRNNDTPLFYKLHEKRPRI